MTGKFNENEVFTLETPDGWWYCVGTDIAHEDYQRMDDQGRAVCGGVKYDNMRGPFDSEAEALVDGYATDDRMWRVTAETFGSDSGPFTTTQVFETAAQLNADDPDGTPIRLVDHGDRLVDVSRDSGDGDYLAATLVTGNDN